MSNKNLRKKIIKKAFFDAKNITLTSKEKEILNSATAEELAEAKAFSEAVAKKNTEELLAEEDARLAQILEQTDS